MTKETVNTNLKSKNKKNRDNQKRRMFREKIVEKIVQIKRVSKVVKGGKN
jgi:ribosomal protein S5